MLQNEQDEVITRPTMIIKKMSSYHPEEIGWLEEGRIAMGKLTLIAGDPGLGKSFLTLELCARVSRGEIGQGKSVMCPRAVILSAEDDANDTIHPRLDRMCADLKFIHFIEGIRFPGDPRGKMPQLDKDIQTMARDIQSLGNVALIVIDPISAYMGKADSHNNAEVRSVLAELAHLAKLTGAAVVCVTHLNKDSGNKRAVYRAMGSLAFTAAARTVHLVTKHPGKGELDDRKCVVSMVKNNIGVQKPARVYVIEDGAFTWLDEEVDISDDMLDGQGNDRPLIAGETGIDKAVSLLNDELASAERLASEIIKLGKERGIGMRTLNDAKRVLCVISEKKGKFWYWRLPPSPGEYEHPQANNPTRDDLLSYGHQGYL